VGYASGEVSTPATISIPIELIVLASLPSNTEKFIYEPPSPLRQQSRHLH
jgi:hypothetical protein